MLFSYQKEIGKHISMYMVGKGYSKTSFATLTNISIAELEYILQGKYEREEQYEESMKKITNTLQVNHDYFLEKPKVALEKWQTNHSLFEKCKIGKEKKVQKAYEDLGDLLDIASVYIK